MNEPRPSAESAAGADDEPRALGGRATRWLSWVLGAAALGAVVVVAVNFSETRQFLRIAERAQPWWLLAAVALQAATYMAEGMVWRTVARAAGYPLPIHSAYALALTKLFVDQALPSGGISGTAVVARSLQDRGMPRPAVMAGVVVDFASYYSVYVVCLAVAVLISVVHHRANELIELTSVAFAILAAGLTAVVLSMSGRHPRRLTGRLARLRLVRRALAFLEDADPRLSRSPRVLLRSAAWQLTLFLLDAATVWVLIRALGESATLPGVFASFMISTLFRTVGVLPGGLGTFEATSVLTLHLIGVDVAVGLAATLLFRGLSFWLPMIPGLWLSRRSMAHPDEQHSPPGH